MTTYQEIVELTVTAPAGEKILDRTLKITKFLLEKNIAYGNSAIKPVRIFSKANAEEQLLVRIDDKLNRIINNQSYSGDDDVLDLVGYLILLLVLRDNSD